MFKSNATNTTSPDSDLPKDRTIDPEGWKVAEDMVRARNGGFAGVSDEGKYRQIKEAYDQLVDSNAKAAKWEGRDD